jgi:hypothetical protein
MKKKKDLNVKTDIQYQNAGYHKPYFQNIINFMIQTYQNPNS